VDPLQAEAEQVTRTALRFWSLCNMAYLNLPACRACAMRTACADHVEEALTKEAPFVQWRRIIDRLQGTSIDASPAG
jgi:hypothetical protein